jgi:hypothetical protein
VLPPEAIEIIETLPADKRHAVESVVRMVAKSHRGPLPDGETLEHYQWIGLALTVLLSAAGSAPVTVSTRYTLNTVVPVAASDVVH